MGWDSPYQVVVVEHKEAVVLLGIANKGCFRKPEAFMNLVGHPIGRISPKYVLEVCIWIRISVSIK